MKTTIEVPDELFRRLKQQAQREGRPMRELVIDGLRRELQERAHARSHVDFAFPTSSVGGWLVPGVTLDGAIEASYPVRSL